MEILNKQKIQEIRKNKNIGGDETIVISLKLLWKVAKRNRIIYRRKKLLKKQQKIEKELEGFI